MAITTFQDDRVYVAGITHSTSLFPISCPLTSNPYCDSICSGCNTDPSPSTDGDAFIAQLLAGPFTGINEEETILEFESRFVLYPNPSETEITLRIELPDKSDLRIRVFNMIGELVLADQLSGSSGWNEYSIDLSGFSDGMYLMQIALKEETQSMKFIKQ